MTRVLARTIAAGTVYLPLALAKGWVEAAVIAVAGAAVVYLLMRLWEMK